MKSSKNWKDILAAARTTVGKEDAGKEPSSRWKSLMLYAEHSPIRKLRISYTWRAIKYWVSVHITRHSKFTEHYVTTSRSDRTGVDRNRLPQDHRVDHEIDTNAQAIINISRKRLCYLASPETRHAWERFLDDIAHDEPELRDVCVPDCVYRGKCFEMHGCGWYQSFGVIERKDYEKKHNDLISK